MKLAFGTESQKTATWLNAVSRIRHHLAMGELAEADAIARNVEFDMRRQSMNRNQGGSAVLSDVLDELLESPVEPITEKP